MSEFENNDSLSVSTPTVMYALNQDQNRQIAALHHVASRDLTRPVLCGIHIRYSGDKLVFTVTDSFKMAERSYDVTNKRPQDCNVKKLDGVNHGTVIVNTIALRDALNVVKSSLVTTLELGNDGVTVSANAMSLTIPTVPGQYPNVEQFWTKHSAGDVFAAKHVAILAEYLWSLSRSTGLTPKRMGPMVLTGTDELKPLHIRMPGESNWRAILMPVRV